MTLPRARRDITRKTLSLKRGQTISIGSTWSITLLSDGGDTKERVKIITKGATPEAREVHMKLHDEQQLSEEVMIGFTSTQSNRSRFTIHAPPQVCVEIVKPRKND